MYSILGRGSFCFNYCLNSAWHGGDQFVALLRWYGSPGFFDSGLQLICIFWSLVFILLLTIPHRLSMGFRSGEFAGQSSTPTPWSFNQLLVLLAVWAGTKSCWKMKSLSVVQEWLNKRNTTTVAKFLDTSVCGGSWCLDPSLSPFLVKFTQILESILLDNPRNAAVLSVGCASFSSTLFPSTQLSVNMLGYSTLWTASLFGNECLWLTLLVKGVNDCLLDNCQISSLPHDCVA